LASVISSLLSLACLSVGAGEPPPPVRLAVVGLSHDHAFGFFPRLHGRRDVQLVGVVESNPELVTRYESRFHLQSGLFCRTLEELLARTNVEAAAVFTSAYDHQRVVQECAAKGVDVMMEKPMAVNLEQARAIEAAAKAGGIQIIVNYETTWYPSTQAAHAIACDRHEIGELRRFVVHDGHRGPKEIGCSTNFLDWLTDPVLNGGGALVDFGCYGADLITWFMGGTRPSSVFAVTQQIKPNLYPKVDDDATLVLTYPKTVGIIQASWNWPFDRKDMEIYGQSGYVLAPRSDLLEVRETDQPQKEIVPPPLAGSEADPISYLVAVRRREIKPTGLSSIEVNLIVTEILDAARESARTGRRIDLAR
jgi:predicted dehydrogenase